MPKTSLVLHSLIFSSLIRHHLSGPFFRFTRLTVSDKLGGFLKLDSDWRSGGGVGRPGVGIASNGTLVGGNFLRSEDGDCRECEEPEELDGESSDGVESNRGLGDGGWLLSATSFEFRALSLGLGAADILGLGAGLERTL
jgi:hypothetical protein